MGTLTRKERQAQTRAQLLRSASKLVAERGFGGASIDEVVADAGYTKGAFYANFESKEQMLFAVLDELFARRLVEIDRVASSDTRPEVLLRRGAENFAQFVAGDIETEQLMMELNHYAMRNPEFRELLGQRYAQLRERLGEIYARRMSELGVNLSLPVADIVQMTQAMARGFALARLIEGDGIPEDLFAQMLATTFAGLLAASVNNNEVA